MGRRLQEQRGANRGQRWAVERRHRAHASARQGRAGARGRGSRFAEARGRAAGRRRIVEPLTITFAA